MVKTKRRRILFAVITIAIATAGTFLTLLNNIDINAWQDSIIAGLLSTGIAVALAACFTAMEAAFIYAHKEIEEVSKLWRKSALITIAIILVCAMGFAAYQEMKVTQHKLDNKSLASNFTAIIKSADTRNQRSLGRSAINAVKDDKIKTETLPFAIGYVVAGISAILIAAIGEKVKERKRGEGNLIVSNPVIASKIQQRFGVDPATARAYRDRNGGAAIWHNSRQIGFLSKYDIE